MNMRKSIPLLLVTLLLVQSLMSITVQNVEATMGRGGSDDDYSVTEIMVNSTTAKPLDTARWNSYSIRIKRVTLLT